VTGLLGEDNGFLQGCMESIMENRLRYWLGEARF
jgi:hypothetical protein